MADFTAVDASYWIESKEFILEVADEIERLNGRPTSKDRCSAAWHTYEASPSDATKEALQLAYEAIPKHNRRYVLGDMDRKDHPIRYVLYPEQYQQA